MRLVRANKTGPQADPRAAAARSAPHSASPVAAVAQVRSRAVGASPVDALSVTLARAIERSAARRAEPVLARMRVRDGTVGGARARYIEMTAREIAHGDNGGDDGLSLYTAGASGCATVVTRHGSMLRLGHAIASSQMPTRTMEAVIVNTWLQGPPPDQVILVFGTDYADESCNYGSHLVEQMLTASGYSGRVDRYYNASSFIVDPDGNVQLDPPKFVAAAAGAQQQKGCCVLF